MCPPSAAILPMHRAHLSKAKMPLADPANVFLVVKVKFATD